MPTLYDCTNIFFFFARKNPQDLALFSFWLYGMTFLKQWEKHSSATIMTMFRLKLDVIITQDQVIATGKDLDAVFHLQFCFPNKSCNLVKIKNTQERYIFSPLKIKVGRHLSDRYLKLLDTEILPFSRIGKKLRQVLGEKQLNLTDIIEQKEDVSGERNKIKLIKQEMKLQSSSIIEFTTTAIRNIIKIMNFIIYYRLCLLFSTAFFIFSFSS